MFRKRRYKDQKKHKKERKEHKVKHHKLRHRESLIETETQLVKSVAGWIFQAKATTFLILINLVVYFISLTWSADYFQSMIFTPDKLMQLPQLASWFLHANPTHLIGNMIFLFIFGRVVERRFGFFKFLLIYFCAAIVSDLIAGLVFGQGGIGASGAIAGLIAAAIIVDPFYLTYIVFGIPVPVIVLGWIAVFADITGLISPVPGDNIGHIAHLAGFFAITLLVFIFNIKSKKIKLGLFINVLTLIFGTLLYYFVPVLSFSNFVPWFNK